MFSTYAISHRLQATGKIHLENCLISCENHIHFHQSNCRAGKK